MYIFADVFSFYNIFFLANKRSGGNSIIGVHNYQKGKKSGYTSRKFTGSAV